MNGNSDQLKRNGRDAMRNEVMSLVFGVYAMKWLKYVRVYLFEQQEPAKALHCCTG